MVRSPPALPFRRGSPCLSASSSASSASSSSSSSLSTAAGRRRCMLYDLTEVHFDERGGGGTSGDGGGAVHHVPYVRAWRMQQALQRRAIAAQRLAEKCGQAAADDADDAAGEDSLLLLEHASVYTLGRRATLANLRFDATATDCPHAIHRVERGGEVTWHGPGQLVGYPILDLTREPHRKDLNWYLRQIEATLIDTLGHYGVKAVRDDAGTGVWVGDAKIAAMGLSASRWVTMHGFALNVEPDMASFGRIVPCGIEDRPVTSLRTVLGAACPSLPDVRATLLRHFASSFELELVRAAAPPRLPDAEQSDEAWHEANRRPLER